MSLRSSAISLALGWALGGGALAQVAEVPLAPSAPLDRTVSASRQFHVYHSDLKARGSFASFLEGVKAEFLEMLQQRDQWVTPILVRIHGRLTDAPIGRPVQQEIVLRGDGALQWLELHAHLGVNFSREELRKAVLQALTFELASRDAEREITPDLLPLWVREGVPGAARFRREGKPSALFASIFKSGQVLSAENLLGAKEAPRNSVSRAVFEASAAGFIRMLLSQPSGPKKTAAFLHGLGGGQSSITTMLASQFPGLRGKPERLEKEWALFVATLAKPKALEFMSAADTEAALEKALQVSFLEYKDGKAPKASKDSKKAKPRWNFWRKREAESVDVAAKIPADGQAEAKPEAPEADTVTVQASITEFARYLKRKDRETIVGQSLAKLDELTMRAYPIYTPLAEDYKVVLRKLAKGDSGGAERKFKALAEERKTLKEKLGKIHEYLDWYEVTQTTRKSGAFDEFMRRVREVEGGVTRRDDQVSRYLDTLERALK